MPTSADSHGGRDFFQWKSLQGINLFIVSIKASLNRDQVEFTFGQVITFSGGSESSSASLSLLKSALWYNQIVTCDEGLVMESEARREW